MFARRLTLVRRIFWTLVTIGLAVWGTHYYEWHKDQFHVGDGWKSLGILGIGIVAVMLALWLILDEKRFPRTAAIIVSILATAVVVEKWHDWTKGFETKPLMLLLGLPFALLVLVTLIVIDKVPMPNMKAVVNKLRRNPTPAAQAVI